MLNMKNIYKNIDTRENYNILLSSGMFFEFHPELTGNWDSDKFIILAPKKNKKTPRQTIKELEELNKTEGFYGTHYQFILLNEQKLQQKTLKIMESLFYGVFLANERKVYNEIYNLLLDGYSMNNIKKIYR